ncbi:hypothetical protein [Lacunimicrobium album]
MARKTLLDRRREAEAAEKLPAEAKVKKTVKRKAKRRTKAASLERKRMVWVIFSGALKEEGRFNYDQKDEALEKLELLRSKSKKLYFLQPVKEVIGQEAPKSKVVIEDDEELTDEVAGDEEAGDEEVEVELEVEEDDAFDDDADADDAGEEDFADDDE